MPARTFFLLFSSAHASGGGFLSRASWLQRSLLVPPAALCLLEAYSRAPPLTPPTEAPPPLLPPGAAPAPRDLVVVLPGAGGPDANTARIAATLRAAGGREVVEYDWRPWKGDELRAPYDALRLGTRLGTELGRRTDQPRSVHLVGVSVGAFVADAIAKSYATTAGAGLCGNQGGSDLGSLALRRLPRSCTRLPRASASLGQSPAWVLLGRRDRPCFPHRRGQGERAPHALRRVHRARPRGPRAAHHRVWRGELRLERRLLREHPQHGRPRAAHPHGQSAAHAKDPCQ
jgi:hypothetical protein